MHYFCGQVLRRIVVGSHRIGRLSTVAQGERGRSFNEHIDESMVELIKLVLHLYL